jgi:hypothetical protein
MIYRSLLVLQMRLHNTNISTNKFRGSWRTGVNRLDHDLGSTYENSRRLGDERESGRMLAKGNLAPRAGFEPATNRLTADCCEVSPWNGVTHLITPNALYINTYLEKRVTYRHLSEHGNTAKNVVTGLSRRHRQRTTVERARAPSGNTSVTAGVTGA